MRVLLVCHRYPPDLGGAEAFAASLARALSRLGHTVTVLASTDAPDRSHSTSDGVEVHRVPFPQGRRKGVRFVPRMVRAGRGLPRPDVIFAHKASLPAVAAILLGRSWRCPVVAQPSSGARAGGNLQDFVKRYGGGLRVAFLRRYVDAFVAITSDIVRDLVEVWRVPERKIVKIPYGVELDRFTPDEHKAPGSAREYLYVGRLYNRQKALDGLIDAWSAAGEPGILTLVGDGPDRAMLEARAPASVQFVGAAADPSPWYRRADVFVLPSRWEGLSNSLLEAVASGLPVIATPVSGTADVLGDTGRVVPCDDVEALASALAAPPPPAVDAASFRERFDINAVARQHARLYERLIEERGRRRGRRPLPG
ncbi:MAG: glycosyltransferase family 4 protein [Actinobacteria bacterium]|nr:MAG: glycosyltransferase family 4 protein [Actinomycetota bacterium]